MSSQQQGGGLSCEIKSGLVVRRKTFISNCFVLNSSFREREGSISNWISQCVSMNLLLWCQSRHQIRNVWCCLWHQTKFLITILYRCSVHTHIKNIKLRIWSVHVAPLEMLLDINVSGSKGSLMTRSTTNRWTSTEPGPSRCIKLKFCKQYQQYNSFLQSSTIFGTHRCKLQSSWVWSKPCSNTHARTVYSLHSPFSHDICIDVTVRFHHHVTSVKQ